VGRGHLIRSIAVLAALVLAAAAGAAGTWREIADGRTTGAPVTGNPAAYVALTRADTAAFSSRLGAGASKLAHVDWKTTALVAILADWGCNDNMVGIGDVKQKATKVHVLLVHGEPPAGTANCQAVYGVYRLITVPKSALHKPYPTRAVIDVA
jgi:hypothetical protein